jgi:hypothetical protein
MAVTQKTATPHNKPKQQKQQQQQSDPTQIFLAGAIAGIKGMGLLGPLALGQQQSPGGPIHADINRDLAGASGNDPTPDPTKKYLPLIIAGVILLIVVILKK